MLVRTIALTFTLSLVVLSGQAEAKTPGLHIKTGGPKQRVALGPSNIELHPNGRIAKTSQTRSVNAPGVGQLVIRESKTRSTPDAALEHRLEVLGMQLGAPVQKATLQNEAEVVVQQIRRTDEPVLRAYLMGHERAAVDVSFPRLGKKSRKK